MKFLVAAFAFVITLGLAVQTLAAGGGGHGGLSEKMNSLFPMKKPDQSKVDRPSVVEIRSPAFLKTVQAGIVSLEWNPSQGATNYHLQIATDPNFKWLLINENFLKVTNYDFPAKARNQYFWRVASIKADNDSSFTKSNFVSSVFTVK
jgi:hypothetical protein